jgi:hypothetical protein
MKFSDMQGLKSVTSHTLSQEAIGIGTPTKGWIKSRKKPPKGNAQEGKGSPGMMGRRSRDQSALIQKFWKPQLQVPALAWALGVLSGESWWPGARWQSGSFLLACLMRSQKKAFHSSFYFFWRLKDKPKAFPMLGKCSTTELHPRSSRFCF